MLLDKQASPHATAKNGHTPLHIAAKKNQVIYYILWYKSIMFLFITAGTLSFIFITLDIIFEFSY